MMSFLCQNYVIFMSKNNHSCHSTSKKVAITSFYVAFFHLKKSKPVPFWVFLLHPSHFMSFYVILRQPFH